MKKWLFCLQVNVPPSCLLDGVHTQHFFGTGVIVHHSQEMGLVAVDKNTVAISASDVMLSFAAYPIEIPGEVNFCRVGILEFGSHFMPLKLLPISWQVVFLHPVYNYALVAYNPSALGALGASMVHAAELLPSKFDFIYLVLFYYCYFLYENIIRSKKYTTWRL